MKSDLKLIFVNPIGKNGEDMFEYDFFFTDDINSVWGEDWDVDFPGFSDNMLPYPNSYTTKKRLITDVPLFCMQENTCFSMQDMVNGIVCCAFEDLSNYETYPEPYRLVFQYGEEMASVVQKLEGREIEFE